METDYQDRSFSSFVLAIMFIKMIFFIIFVTMFIAPTSNLNNMQGFACNVFMVQPDQKLNAKIDPSLSDAGYGAYQFKTASDATLIFSELNAIGKCALQSNDINTMMHNTWNTNIPDLIWFLLFDIWGFLIAIKIIRIIFKI